MAVQPQAVIDAWADMASWVNGTLPGLVTSTPLPNDVYDAGDLGACQVYNTPGPDPEADSTFWGSAGDASVTLANLTVTTMAGVAGQPGTAVDGQTVQLPMSFTTLAVDGSYSYTQPCAMYDMGKQAQTLNATGDGTVTQTISSSNLYYTANCGETVTFTGVTVNGTPAVNVVPDTGGMPSWLVSLGNALSHFDEADAMTSTLQNVFLSASFSTTMLALLNQKLEG